MENKAILQYSRVWFTPLTSAMLNNVSWQKQMVLSKTLSNKAQTWGNIERKMNPNWHWNIFGDGQNKWNMWFPNLKDMLAGDTAFLSFGYSPPFSDSWKWNGNVRGARRTCLLICGAWGFCSEGRNFNKSRNLLGTKLSRKTLAHNLEVFPFIY